jgi:hypothetical protein
VICDGGRRSEVGQAISIRDGLGSIYRAQFSCGGAALPRRLIDFSRSIRARGIDSAAQIGLFGKLKLTHCPNQRALLPYGRTSTTTTFGFAARMAGSEEEIWRSPDTRFTRSSVTAMAVNGRFLTHPPRQLVAPRTIRFEVFRLEES